MPTTIEGNHVTKIYGDLQKQSSAKPAVSDVSFEIQQGELFIVMGLSGSGKSTLLRMLNRLIEPTSGDLLINGTRLKDMDAKQLRRVRNNTINMVFQHFAIFPHRTVLENVSYGLKVRGVPRKRREEHAKQSLETVGLENWASNYPSDLSGGMRQRVGLARALATDSEILLMDEPFSALDPLIRHDMQDLLIHLQRRLEKTIVFVTHDLNEAMRLGDRIMVMRDGGVVQLGTAEEILSAPADDYVADFVGDVDRSRVMTADTTCEPARLTVTPDRNVASVLAQMGEHNVEAAYVLDGGRRILGTVTRRSLQEATGHRTAVGSLITPDYKKVSATATLNECFDLVGGHAVPLAVVDEQNRLCGVLPRATLLSTLSNGRAA